MAVIVERAAVDVKVVFTINEEEARALDALAGYGDDAFVQAFYEKLGKAYMRDHEAGLRSFLRSIREAVPGILSKADRAREAFSSKKQAS